MTALNNHRPYPQVHTLQRVLRVILKRILINLVLSDFELDKKQFSPLSAIEMKRVLQDKSIRLYTKIHKSNER